MKIKSIEAESAQVNYYLESKVAKIGPAVIFALAITYLLSDQVLL